MKFGAGFPLVASEDAAAARHFAKTLDGAGFQFVTSSGHLLAAAPNRFPDRPAATYVGPFHEPFVLFSYLAAGTERIRFRTSILILPLLQAAAVASQAAELSRLSGGRIELGVGISWNQAEYRALNQDFGNRGRRLEEQIAVMRRLWTEPFVTFEGRWHSFDGIGLNWLPEAPIPIWIGSGTSDRVLRRVAALADGWIAMTDPTEPMLRLRQFMEEAGRDPSKLGLTGRISAGAEGAKDWIQAATHLQAAGATHLTISAPPEFSGARALERIVEAKQTLAAELGEG
jgi:probable F420-dependent oxidoreductase